MCIVRYVGTRAQFLVVVKILLKYDNTDPSTMDGQRHTALFWACWKGCEGVVKMLLEWKDVSPSTVDRQSQTQL